ncbi:hypothetical protein [Candidatus Rhodobacter oscarellae]|nr:hypothetical protein [Candidatus Rhodobacter lobularis]
MATFDKLLAKLAPEVTRVHDAAEELMTDIGIPVLCSPETVVRHAMAEAAISAQSRMDRQPIEDE